MPSELCHPGCFYFPVGTWSIDIKVPGPFDMPQVFEINFPGRIVQKDAVYALLMPIDSEPVHGISVRVETFAVIARGCIVILGPGAPKPAVQK